MPPASHAQEHGARLDPQRTPRTPAVPATDDRTASNAPTPPPSQGRSETLPRDQQEAAPVGQGEPHWAPPRQHYTTCHRSDQASPHESVNRVWVRPGLEGPRQTAPSQRSPPTPQPVTQHRSTSPPLRSRPRRHPKAHPDSPSRGNKVKQPQARDERYSREPTSRSRSSSPPPSSEEEDALPSALAVELKRAQLAYEAEQAEWRARKARKASRRTRPTTSPVTGSAGARDSPTQHCPPIAANPGTPPAQMPETETPAEEPDSPQQGPPSQASTAQEDTTQPPQGKRAQTTPTPPQTQKVANHPSTQHIRLQEQLNSLLQQLQHIQGNAQHPPHRQHTPQDDSEDRDVQHNPRRHKPPDTTRTDTQDRGPTPKRANLQGTSAADQRSAGGIRQEPEPISLSDPETWSAAAAATAGFSAPGGDTARVPDDRVNPPRTPGRRTPTQPQKAAGETRGQALPATLTDHQDLTNTPMREPPPRPENRLIHCPQDDSAKARVYGIPFAKGGHPVVVEGDYALFTELNNIHGTGGGRRFDCRRDARGYCYRALQNQLPPTLCTNCFLDHEHYECPYPLLNHRPHLLPSHPLCPRCLTIHPPAHMCPEQATPGGHTTLTPVTHTPQPQETAPGSRHPGARAPVRGTTPGSTPPPSLPPSPPASPTSPPPLPPSPPPSPPAQAPAHPQGWRPKRVRRTRG